MHRNAHSVEIERPAAEVFSYLADAGKRLQWMGVLVESTPLSEGPPRVGSRWRDVFEDHGHRIELEAELVRCDPNELLEARLVSSGFEATSTQRLEELDGRTRLTTVIETEYTARAARLFAPLVTRHAQKQLEADLVALKALIEREG